MEPLEIKLLSKDATIRCIHEDRWPPVHTRLDQPIEAQRASGLVDDHKYEQIKTWGRVCGLQAMEAGKCLACPHVRVEDKGVASGLRELHAVEKPRRARGTLPQPSKAAPPFAQATKGRNKGRG